jgi:hypothetical protein
VLIAEEYLLLALHDESGKPRIGGDRLEPALGGALVWSWRCANGSASLRPRPAGPSGEVRRRLQSALVGGEIPAERTVALIALLRVTGLLPKVVTTEDKKALRARAKQMTEGDWAAKAVKEAIGEAAAASGG